MTNSDNLEEKIRLLLENSVVEPSEFFLISGYNLLDATRKSREVLTETKNVEFAHKQGVLLKKLYYSLAPTKKKDFIKILRQCLEPSGNLTEASVAFHALLVIGKFDEAIETIKKCFTDHRQIIYLILLSDLDLILRIKWTLLNSNEINELYSWAGNTLSGSNPVGKNMKNFASIYTAFREELQRIKRDTNILKTRDLQMEIEGNYNPEVNEDKERLKEEFSKFGFSEDLAATLEKIDQKFSSASDEFDYKGCMDLTRSFSERVFENVISKISSNGDRNVDEKDSEDVAKFFISKNFLSADQAKLLVAVRHFLSNTAAHRLKSKEEDARLTRNIVIELSLYLMRRLDNFLS